jgi:NADH-quinone oxidoreductase subunit L
MTPADPVLQDPLLNRYIAWAILLLPLAGFVVLSLLGDWIKRDKEDKGAGLLACATVLSSFGLSVWAALRLWALLPDHEGLRFAQPYLGYEWMEAGGFRVPISLLLDPLSVVMILVVTGVGSLIHIYSLGYMAHDEDQVRYFSYLNLFTFFMLMLVLGGNLPLAFVGWEGVGLCSYLLIGFWYKKKSASDAGKKAFIVNRIGDAGLILGMVLAYHAFGSLDFVDIASNAGSLVGEALWEWGPITLACLLFFVGATGKSAQIPLHVWLPDAMEGPTPVSALIHAATMVTAGVYMVARLAPLYAKSETAMLAVAVVGALTALMAATVALVQTDIKKVLAYSTVSQLGYMFLACGVGVFGVGVFHLFTHAFFKALLFLGSGSVIHAMSGEQDMRQMGGLRGKIPWTFWTFVIGWLAIAGIPPFAGFYSKDEILLGAWNSHGPLAGLLFAVGFLTAFLTAFYMSRLLFLTFYGKFRGSHEAEHHLHESPWTMLAPLVILAIGSVGSGYALFPGHEGARVRLPEVVQPVFRLGEAHLAHVAWLPVAATLSAVLGILIAWYLYLAMPSVRAGLARALRPALAVFSAKYYFDHVYDGFVKHVVVRGSEALLWTRVDAFLIDGAVNRLGTLMRGIAHSLRPVQTGFVRHYALLLLAGAVAVVSYLLSSAARVHP